MHILNKITNLNYGILFNNQILVIPLLVSNYAQPQPSTMTQPSNCETKTEAVSPQPTWKPPSGWRPTHSAHSSGPRRWASGARPTGPTTGHAKARPLVKQAVCANRFALENMGEFMDLWWFMGCYGDFMVILLRFYGDFMVIYGDVTKKKADIFMGNSLSMEAWGVKDIQVDGGFARWLLPGNLLDPKQREIVHVMHVPCV